MTFACPPAPRMITGCCSGFELHAPSTIRPAHHRPGACPEHSIAILGELIMWSPGDRQAWDVGDAHATTHQEWQHYSGPIEGAPPSTPWLPRGRRGCAGQSPEQVR